MKSFRNSVIILSISVLIIFLAYTNINKPTEVKKQVSKANTISEPVSQDLDTVPTSTASTKNPKSYSSSISYEVPDSTQSIKVSIILDNGIVTAVKTSHSMEGRNSRGYQEDFEAEYKKLVIGKNIKEIRLSRVAGASLTTEAFNKALSQIKNSL